MTKINDELGKAVASVLKDVESYNGELGEIMDDATPLSPQQLRHAAAYIIAEQVDTDEEIIIRAVNFVRANKAEANQINAWMI